MIQTGIARTQWVAAAAMSALLASCAAGPQPGTPPVAGNPPVTAPAAGAIKYTSSGHAAMDAWRIDFSSRALEAGHDRAIVESLLSGIAPIPLWLGSDMQVASTGISDQAEFSKPIWDYLKVPLGESRISNGRDRLAIQPALFADLEARYGVDRQVLVAIWGMETSYGAVIGNFDAGNVLANMAVEGRRRTFAERELLAVIKMVERGDAERSDLLAGWAGAMGQTQFMPTTYLAYAEDFDGDGHKDVWKNEGDALASAANYLKKSGYAMGQPWGLEVAVPAGFDFSLADGNERRMDTWRAAGLTPIAGGAFETGGADFSQLWLPAGAEGPKYLLFNNFTVFKAYNNADSYAFAVGMAGDAIAGKTGPMTPWPQHLRPLSVADIKTLQAGLNARGFSAGPVDGIPGRQTKLALQGFQKSRGLVADGYPTREMLALVIAGNGGVGVSSVTDGPS
ncbi:lytic murein transglycosylase [Hyphomonas sp.]|uniref:lytic murein transglycosylase n=1 Tax=Hyphomonas sp. TaxID=87 RepID=UPI0032EBD171